MSEQQRNPDLPNVPAGLVTLAYRLELRDLFAMQIASGLAADGKLSADEIVGLAYHIAEQMMIKRAEK